MNSTPTPKWITRLCDDVQAGQFSTNLDEERFNDVLKWLLGREFLVGSLISDCMRRVYVDEDKSRQNTFLALDDALFVFSGDSPFAKLGLPERTELPAAKVRYRRLIQLYHPDKGLAEAAGLSHRAEKINHAYDQIKSGKYLSQPIAPTHYRDTPLPANVVRPTAAKTVYRDKISNQIRWALGSPEKMLYVVMSVLVVGAIIILLSVYSRNKPLDEPQYAMNTDVQDTGEEKRFMSIADLSNDESPPEPEPVSTPTLVVTEPEPEPVPVLVETEPEPTPVLAKTEPEPVPVLAETEPKPVPVLAETEPEPIPVLAEIEPEPVPVLAETEPEPTLTIAETKPSAPPYQAPPPRHITMLSDNDRQQSMEVLVGYVNGMIEGDVSKSLHYVGDTVLVDGEQTRKNELRQSYSDWLNDTTSHEYKIKVTSVAVRNGMVRISGKTSIKFTYAERKPVKYKGVLHFDIQLDAFGGKIVAITRG